MIRTRRIVTDPSFFLQISDDPSFFLQILLTHILLFGIINEHSSSVSEAAFV